MQQLGPIQREAQGLSSQLGNVGGGLLAGLVGQSQGAGPGVAPAIGGLLGFGGGGAPGTGLLRGAGSSAQELLGPSPGLQGSLDALNAAIQNNLQGTVGTIAGQATLAGQTGGSRQALVSALAGQEAQRQFAAGAADLVGQDFRGRQQLAPQLVGQQIAAGQALNQQALGASAQQLQALQGAGQLGLGAGAAQADASLGALGQLGSLFNLGMAPFSAGFSPLLSLAQILGSPTVLRRGEQTSSSTGSSRAEGFSFEF